MRYIVTNWEIDGWHNSDAKTLDHYLFAGAEVAK